ncbi:hypothetical protein MKEN_01264600 [Mycena kentingensis (nom. inval.)]|nr:hypothetical protein MKEN_01264600 [Mycena kentingensis (nom. inval.)]
MHDSPIQDSPISSIPYEIVREIILWALTPTKSQWCSLLLPPRANDVLVMACICSVWRQIALETSRIWALPRMPITDAMGRLSEQATRMFVQRSGLHPFNVDIWPIWDDDILELPAALTNAANRWERLSLLYFNRPLSVAEADVLGPVSGSRWESLVELEVSFTDATNWNSLALDFTPATNLRRVILNVPDTFVVPPMPWAQLTRLHLAHPLPHICLAILACCRDLVSLRINTDQWDEDEFPDVPGPEGSLLLEHLVELELHSTIWTTGEHLAPFLRLICAPLLGTLKVSLNPEPSDAVDGWHVPGLNSKLGAFILRSPRIEELSLVRCVLSEELPLLLRGTPALRSLKLGTTEVDRDFMLSLNLKYKPTGKRRRPLVPKLNRLELLDVGNSFPHREFARMVESRLATLQEVVVENVTVDVLGVRQPSKEFLDFSHKAHVHGLYLRVLL